jgi:predicted Zn-dependent protease
MSVMLEEVERHFERTCPDPSAGFFSLRVVRERSERLRMRQGVLLPVELCDDTGLMATAHAAGGVGYAATSDLSERGVAGALETAGAWASRTAEFSVLDSRGLSMPHPRGDHRAESREPWASTPLSEKIERLARASERLKSSPEIVDWEAELWFTRTETLYLTNGGGRAFQSADLLVPNLVAIANRGADTQARSTRYALGRQGGLEVLEAVRFDALSAEMGEEARALLDSPDCPTGKMDLVLAPDQMILQLHESIGHPLELDRILGDERNFAGTSFVTKDMFGAYRYGSELLDVSFDPGVGSQFASYRWDDDGVLAEKTMLIDKGILVAPLGSVVSQTRAGMRGVANSRATSWNRPPIDRMANLNIEPGTSTLDELIGGVEHGVYMKTNRSWSIDDSRNKFQFGCELGRIIENGKLGKVVKNPNYRGISATFWRSLSGVGNRDTLDVLGTPFCGKGEPNQIIRVGHATPACRFTGVDVFGGA